MYLLLLPINSFRLIQIVKLVKKARIAAQGDLSIDWLKPFMDTRAYKKGDVLFRKGEKADEMFLITTGKFLVKEIGVELLPGRLMGELGFRHAQQQAHADGRMHRGRRGADHHLRPPARGLFRHIRTSAISSCGSRATGCCRTWRAWKRPSRITSSSCRRRPRRIPQSPPSARAQRPWSGMMFQATSLFQMNSRYDRAHGRADKSRALMGHIQSRPMADKGGEERPGDAEHDGENKSMGLVRARHDQARDGAGDEADEYNPEQDRHYRHLSSRAKSIVRLIKKARQRWRRAQAGNGSLIGNLIDRHLVGDAAQMSRRCAAGASFDISSILATCGLSTTGLVARIACESARPCTRAAILTVWPK